MKYDDLRDLGSQTARGGFRNEDDVVSKFNNWQADEDAQKWLIIMKYDLDEIEYVKAHKITREKTDVQVQITVTIKLKKIMDVQNLQVKLVSNLRGFNQIDKRWVKSYVELWGIPDQVAILLKRFTGEESPIIANPRDHRRMFADEFSANDQKCILDFLKNNKAMIVNDILKGRGKLAAEWMLVVQKIVRDARWVLKPMNFVINHFGNGEVIITSQGSFKIGKITVQRKGGDGGRDTAKMLKNLGCLESAYRRSWRTSATCRTPRVQQNSERWYDRRGLKMKTTLIFLLIVPSWYFAHAEGVSTPKWQRIAVHHTATPKSSPFDSDKCAQVHKIRLGVSTCGYNFLIQRDGTVEAPHGWTEPGAHVKNMNSSSLGIALVMDGRTEHPTADQIDSLRALINQTRVLFGNIPVVRHSDLRPTLCPTANVYNRLKKEGIIE